MGVDTEVVHLQPSNTRCDRRLGGRGPPLPPEVVFAPTYLSLFLHLDPKTSCTMQTSTRRAAYLGNVGCDDRIRREVPRIAPVPRH